ncbi:hypothetical protein [Streptomyces sp. MNP-20]|uniref:hypothetical protein n=1 Tax=Streptomyces sp. MNP-20 TaxID=2721165 RepID=UPI001553BA06|nr:hypothetical protein [Streptomyces sp. MNP-20]
MLLPSFKPLPETLAKDPATWTPLGTSVTVRCRNALGPAEGAVVLVYTSDGENNMEHFIVACLGCHYLAWQTSQRRCLPQDAAAHLANAHAADCRAMSCGVPASPSDGEAAQMVRTRLWELRRHESYGVHHVSVADFDRLRVALQRSRDFINATMLQLATSEPHFVAAQDGYRGTRFLVQPHAPRA